MNNNNETMQDYLKKYPFVCGEMEIGGVLGYLTKRYLEDNPISSEEIKKIEQEMGPYYENVPFATSERLFQLVYDLCDAYGETAFQAGITMGLHLREEISKV